MIGKAQLLSPEECDAIVAELGEDQWSKGMSGGDAYSATIKLNEEIKAEAVDRLTDLSKRILACKPFMRQVFPKHIGAPRFNRYTKGGQYKWHTDSAFMSNPEIRCDVSMTLFLTDDYDGGELRMRPYTGDEFSVKETKGTIVYYPTNMTHCVAPVTRGERIAFVAWAQSHVQDQGRREVLSQISRLTDMLQEKDNLSDEHLLAVNIKHQMWRRWMTGL